MFQHNLGSEFKFIFSVWSLFLFQQNLGCEVEMIFYSNVPSVTQYVKTKKSHNFHPLDQDDKHLIAGYAR